MPVILSGSELRRLLPSNAPSGAALIRASDLARIERNATGDSRIAAAAADATRALHNTREGVVQQRGERLAAFDKERRARAPPTLEERERRARQSQICDSAERELIEKEGLVREMESLAIIAKTFTVRDRQLAAKARNELEKALEVEEERRSVNEIVTDLCKEKERSERQKAETQRQMQDFMVADMEAREEARTLLKEEKLREADEIRRAAREAAEREAQEEEARKKAAAELRAAADRINEENRRAKEREAERKRQEDLALAAFNRQQELKEREAEEQKARETARRNTEFARLQQKKTLLDNKRDEVERQKSNAILEKQERKREEEERKQREHDEKVKKQLYEAFEARMREKERLRREEALEKERDLMQAKKTLQEFENDNHDHRNAEVRKMLDMKAMLDIQVKEKEKLLAQAKAREVETSPTKTLLERRAVFEEIRQQKIKQLREAGVEEKYIVPLINMVIEEK